RRALAAQQDAAHVVIGDRGTQRGSPLVVQRVVDRVVALWAVERQHADAIADLVQDQVGHGDKAYTLLTMPGPLEGIRVIELGVVIAGPCASAMLGDWGAE